MRVFSSFGLIQPLFVVEEGEKLLYWFVPYYLQNFITFLLLMKISWQDLFAIAQDQPFRFPSTFTFVIRAFSTLEGFPPLFLCA